MKNEYAGLYKYVKATETNKRILDKYCLASAGPYPNIRGMRENRGWGKSLLSVVAVLPIEFLRESLICFNKL